MLCGEGLHAVCTVHGSAANFETPLLSLLAQANEFQVASKRLPKALRDWPAYKDCRKAIDDFLEQLPLFQSLTHKAVRDRWVGWDHLVGQRRAFAEASTRCQSPRSSSS